MKGNLKEIKIDEEFKALMPALDKETYARLEENILLHGCRDAIVLWDGYIIDGHNRYSICTKHDLPYKTADMEFGNRQEAIIWIISTQVSRRNLTPIQLSHYRGLHYRADKQIQGTSNQYARKSEKGQNDLFQKSTKHRLADRYRVSPKTIARDANVAAAIDAIGEISPEAKRQILTGEINLNKNELGNISMLPMKDIEWIAREIEYGTYKKKQTNPFESPNEKFSTYSDSYRGVLQKFETEVSKITETMFTKLRKRADKDTPEKLKSSFRSYIDMLEKLYGQM